MTPTFEESGCADYLRVFRRLAREYNCDYDFVSDIIALGKGISGQKASDPYLECDTLEDCEQALCCENAGRNGNGRKNEKGK